MKFEIRISYFELASPKWKSNLLLCLLSRSSRDQNSEASWDSNFACRFALRFLDRVLWLDGRRSRFLASDAREFV